ncbi:Eukaryotic translation initiation factor 3 subunit I [Lamellibrachia satsuma]|nr:Eukaryotic translation initiation factor 3 subunit I [Lamellibrachia satsuma]
MLHGHERSITQIRYNREGDLLFSCAKDNQPNVWYAVNGERLGSFKGHTGAVWCLDVNWDTSKVLTGASDNSSRLWDCETGVSLAELTTKSAVRTCGFSYSANTIMFSTDRTMGQACTVAIYDIRDDSQMRNNEPMQIIPMPKEKVTAAIWSPLDTGIITGHENGDLCQWELTTGDLINRVLDHSKQINDIQASNDMTMIITASKDTTAKLFDVYTLKHKKTYKTERPVNSAAISPLKPHVVLGGGQEAMDVTTTSTRIGKFDARFYHLIFEDEFGRVKGHFGPINSVAFQPDGKGYCSGGEDGYVRLHNFDMQYFDFEFEY